MPVFFLTQAGQPDHVDYILLMLLTSPPNDTLYVSLCITYLVG